jgi:hypothetical protein
MNDPNTRVGTSIDSGGMALLRDGKIVYINPQDGDFGTAFKPEPGPGTKWRTPLDYFEQHTRAVEPLPPPAPGRLPPLTPGEMAPRAPAAQPAPAPAPPPPVEGPPVPKPVPPVKGGEMPMIGGGLPVGPQIIPPPHSHPHWVGETPEDLWDNDHH